ncbi:glycosyl hydrolase 108 family protein [Leptotrichia sp. oral taxon 847]|uniref:glycosyl hydrolase 108 family protein n=1 Tax=Leptotrichia sp. oral taxon 847 TaxID=1785996 RepID=UPI0009E8FD71|nr:glycosyl hydrolase 108 family protein [Leptotrichia sp. oral taxon 847]
MENKEKSIEELRKDVVKNAQKIYDRKPRPKYVWGSQGPNYYDCSGFSRSIYKNAGLKIPRISADQSKFTSKKLKKSELKPGDLVFFGKDKVSHVAVYMGDGKIMESGGGGSKNDTPAKAGVGIRIRSIDARKDFRGGISLEDVAVKNKVVSKTEKHKTVQNSDRRFDEIFKYLLKVEGGYSNDKNDSGGKTKYGITEKEARNHGYRGDMRNLSLDFAKEIYKKDYYKKNQLDKVKNDKIALSICDFSVNAGNHGVKKAQETLNKINGTNLKVDGVLGEKTLEALNKTNPENFLKEYHNSQRRYYDSIAHGKNKVFLKGWQNRVSTKENTIKNMNNNRQNSQIFTR